MGRALATRHAVTGVWAPGRLALGCEAERDAHRDASGDVCALRSGPSAAASPKHGAKSPGDGRRAAVTIRVKRKVRDAREVQVAVASAFASPEWPERITKG
jgi:hypothetical protein